MTRNKMAEMINLWRRTGVEGGELYGADVRDAVERELFGGRPPAVVGPVGTPNIPTPQSAPAVPTPIPAISTPVPAPPAGPNKQEVLDAINITIQAKHAEAAQKPWDAGVKTQLGALMGLSEMVMTRPIPVGELKQIMDQLSGMGYVKGGRSPAPAPAPGPAAGNVTPLPGQAVPMAAPMPQLPQAGAGAGGRGGADISSILMGLSSSGLLGGGGTPRQGDGTSTPLAQGSVPSQAGQVKKRRMQEYEEMVLALDVQMTNLDLNR